MGTEKGQQVFFSLNNQSANLANALILLGILNGASDRTRTCNLLIRSQKLYPIELPTPPASDECTRCV